MNKTISHVIEHILKKIGYKIKLKTKITCESKSPPPKKKQTELVHLIVHCARSGVT